MVKKDKWLAKVPNNLLLADARGYRRGVKYSGGEKGRMGIDREIKRRKKLGLISKKAGGTKPRPSGFARNPFGFKPPRF